jgi:para-nitrobenzyl esterase
LGVPEWPAVAGNNAAAVMYIDVNSKAETEKSRDRYLFLEKQMKR